MDNVLFNWDEEKNKSNIKKHGVSFEEARSVFYDDYALYSFDAKHSQCEERFNIIGYSDRLKLLVVCHCYKEKENTIRIISARKATNNEEYIYGGTSW